MIQLLEALVFFQHLALVSRNLLLKQLFVFHQLLLLLLLPLDQVPLELPGSVVKLLSGGDIRGERRIVLHHPLGDRQTGLKIIDRRVERFARVGGLFGGGGFGFGHPPIQRGQFFAHQLE